MKWAIILKVGAKVFGYLIKQVTPEIREVFQDTLIDLYRKAVETPNPFDDHFMAMVLEILDIEKPG